jgi:hypothetical protein
MEEKSIPIVAMVSAAETAVLERACDSIANALGEAGGEQWKCSLRFIQDCAELQGTDAGSIIVTSLVLEVEGLDPWAEAEPRLRELHATICARGNPVFICTVFRHTGSMESRLASKPRIRARRLNLLAAEISRETGAFVIDIDRYLADVGARQLQTDYRLEGATAVDYAGNAIAEEIIRNGLDAFASAATQDRALAAMAQSRLRIAPQVIRPIDLIPMGMGRRKQITATVIDTDSTAHVAWLARKLLRREIGMAYGFSKFMNAVRQRGSRERLAMLASVIGRFIVRRP